MEDKRKIGPGTQVSAAFPSLTQPSGRQFPKVKIAPEAAMVPSRSSKVTNPASRMRSEQTSETIPKLAEKETGTRIGVPVNTKSSWSRPLALIDRIRNVVDRLIKDEVDSVRAEYERLHDKEVDISLDDSDLELISQATVDASMAFAKRMGREEIKQDEVKQVLREWIEIYCIEKQRIGIPSDGEDQAKWHRRALVRELSLIPDLHQIRCKIGWSSIFEAVGLLLPEPLTAIGLRLDLVRKIIKSKDRVSDQVLERLKPIAKSLLEEQKDQNSITLRELDSEILHLLAKYWQLQICVYRMPKEGQDPFDLDQLEIDVILPPTGIPPKNSIILIHSVRDSSLDTGDHYDAGEKAERPAPPSLANRRPLGS